jgi:hypothetical protein
MAIAIAESRENSSSIAQVSVGDSALAERKGFEPSRSF